VARRPKIDRIYRSEGEIVRPEGSGWRNARALVYSRFFEFQVERDEEGWFIGTVPELPGCHTQARSEHELIERLHEAVELAVEDSGDLLSKGLFVSARS
jgi:predicted RNase H-like HicB family nuclease